MIGLSLFRMRLELMLGPCWDYRPVYKHLWRDLLFSKQVQHYILPLLENFSYFEERKVNEILFLKYK